MMVKINRIYTRTGDDGTTGLVGGGRTTKNSLQVEAFGEVDEVNSWLGVVRTEAARSKSATISTIAGQLQNDLFDIGAELATPAGKEWPGMAHTSEQQVAKLEALIDELTRDLPELRSFVLPGGSALNAWLHVARTVCRRAERTVVTFARSDRNRGDRFTQVIRYLNRLSDLLFAMARYESARSKSAEYLWIPGGQRSSSTTITPKERGRVSARGARTRAAPKPNTSLRRGKGTRKSRGRKARK